MHKYATLIITNYITYLSFQLLRNHQILQHKNYSFLYLKVTVKPELSMHGPMGHQNIPSCSWIEPRSKLNQAFRLAALKLKL